MVELEVAGSEQERVAGVADRLRRRFGAAPRLGLVLGSGMGLLVDALQAAESEPYGALGLPEASVPGHAGRLVVGRLGDHPVAVCAGRVHLYEGRSPAEVVRAVRALAAWGVGAVLLTNAVGGITEGFDPGVIVVVSDHLDLQGRNPLVGPAYGTRFPDLSRAYDPELRAILARAAQQVGAPARAGVLAAMLGPSYETPAEVRMLARLGADIVGMSTVPEVVACAEIGARAAVLSIVSNRAAGLTEAPLSHAEVMEVTNQSGDRVVRLIREALPAMVAALPRIEE